MACFQGSALGAMVGQMTYGKRQWEEFDSQMRDLIPVVTSSADDMIKMIDADTDAFNDYMVTDDLLVRFTVTVNAGST